jgi:hypothetical protein
MTRFWIEFLNKYSGALQAVDTRRHALRNPTVVARFKF